MRHIHDHKLPGLNEQIEVVAIDSPGAGGANHRYMLVLPPTALPVTTGKMGTDASPAATPIMLEVFFQNGPILEAGANGFTNEALLTVLIDRMRGFQFARLPDGSFDLDTAGKYACEENQVALAHMQDALYWLKKRTRERLARGVEGTHNV